jgi:hypothetical protein
LVLTRLKRIVKEHSGAHLWAPIVVVVLLSLFLDVLLAGHTIEWRDWPGFWKPLLFDHWRELLSIYLAFTWIVWKSVRRASDVRWTMIGDLSDNLENADRYFAIGTIPLREWFEPNALVYLATIIRQQRERQQSAVPPQRNAFRPRPSAFIPQECGFQGASSFLSRPALCEIVLCDPRSARYRFGIPAAGRA